MIGACVAWYTLPCSGVALSSQAMAVKSVRLGPFCLQVLCIRHMEENYSKPSSNHFGTFLIATLVLPY